MAMRNTAGLDIFKAFLNICLSFFNEFGATAITCVLYLTL